MNKEIELDKHGRLVFRHYSNKNLFLHRPYRWSDRLIMLHESNENGRQVIDEFKYSTFNLNAWIPVTVEEDKLIKSNYTEIYGNK